MSLTGLSGVTLNDISVTYAGSKCTGLTGDLSSVVCSLSKI